MPRRVFDAAGRLCETGKIGAVAASIAHLQDVHFWWRPLLRDPDDDMVLECAIASGANTVVTHNLKDFARARSLGVQAKTPGQFLDRKSTRLNSSHRP